MGPSSTKPLRPSAQNPLEGSNCAAPGDWEHPTHSYISPCYIFLRRRRVPDSTFFGRSCRRAQNAQNFLLLTSRGLLFCPCCLSSSSCSSFLKSASVKGFSKH